jgi:hypothetical protein
MTMTMMHLEAEVLIMRPMDRYDHREDRPQTPLKWILGDMLTCTVLGYACQTAYIQIFYIWQIIVFVFASMSKFVLGKGLL